MGPSKSILLEIAIIIVMQVVHNPKASSGRGRHSTTTGAIGGDAGRSPVGERTYGHEAAEVS